MTIPNCCSSDILRQLYFGCFYSVMKYSIIHWGLATGANRVFLIQKRIIIIIRTIMGLSPLDLCREAFSSLNILTFINVFIYKIVCFFYKNKNKFVTDRANYQYETRHKSSLLTPKHNTALFEEGFFIQWV